MRLIGLFSEEDPQGQEKAYQFSFFLTQKGIENECEPANDAAGNSIYRIWIFDEDRLDEANQYYEEYKNNPSIAETVQAPDQKSHATVLESFKEAEEQEKKAIRSYRPPPYGKITILILGTAILLFIWAQFNRPNIPNKLANLPLAPNLALIEKKLLFDYPFFYELRDKLLTIYTPSDIEKNASPSPEAQAILQKMRSTPHWEGFYDLLVNRIKKGTSLAYDGPMFEKISQGQFYRLFTPALLHFDLLHIFFNALWFIILGNQIEYRIGTLRYILLILIGALLSNTCQYLMSGPFFLGLSGIVTTFAGFIWARQRKAPWEGYLVSRFTLMFLFLFIFGMFVLQFILFFMQIYGSLNITIGIANTAHIVGLLIGYLLGSLPFFSIKRLS